MENKPKPKHPSFFDIPDTVADISRLLIKDNTAYMCCFEESGISYLASMTVGDGEFQKLPLEVEASTSLLDFAFDSKGSTWAVCMDDTDRYSLKKFNRDGQVIQTRYWKPQTRPGPAGICS